MISSNVCAFCAWWKLTDGEWCFNLQFYWFRFIQWTVVCVRCIWCTCKIVRSHHTILGSVYGVFGDDVKYDMRIVSPLWAYTTKLLWAWKMRTFKLFTQKIPTLLFSVLTTMKFPKNKQKNNNYMNHNDENTFAFGIYDKTIWWYAIFGNLHVGKVGDGDGNDEHAQYYEDVAFHRSTAFTKAYKW